MGGRTVLGHQSRVPQTLILPSFARVCKSFCAVVCLHSPWLQALTQVPICLIMITITFALLHASDTLATRLHSSHWNSKLSSECFSLIQRTTSRSASTTAL